MKTLQSRLFLGTPLRILLSALAFGSVAVAGIGHAIEREITFTKVLDSETPIPGDIFSIGPFLDLSEDEPGRRRLYGSPHLAMDDDGNIAFVGGRIFSVLENQLHSLSRIDGDPGHIAIDQGRVTFGVIDLGGQRIGGVFRWEPGAAPFEIVGVRTFVPGGGSCVFWTKENGVSYWPFSIDGDSVLFTGTSNERAYSDGQSFECDDLRGTFLWRNGVIQRVGGFARELHSLRASIDDGLLAYVDGDGAIHAKEPGGATIRLAGPGDPISGRTEVLASVGAPTVAAGRVAFQGRDTAGREGVYLWERGTLSVLAEQGMALPDGRLLERLSTSGTSGTCFRLGDDRVAVFGVDARGPLLYLASLDGDWERVIDGTGRFGSSQDAGDFNGGQLLLEGNAIYVVRRDGSLLEVLRRGGSLDGQRVSVVRAGDLRRNRLVLGIGLEGSSVDHLYIGELPPLPVEIDVKPRRATNRLHPRSRHPTPVVILGSETFPIEDMDAASIRIGPNSAPTRGRPKLRDVNGDGWTDLILRFRPRDAGITRGDSEVCLSGQTHDRIGFEGCDAVTLGR